MRECKYDVEVGCDKNGKYRWFIIDLDKLPSEKGYKVSGYYKYYTSAFGRMMDMNGAQQDDEG